MPPAQPTSQDPPEPFSEPDPPSPGHLAPLGPGALVGAGLLGLLLGWLWRPVAERLTGTAPVLSWTQALVLLFVALILGGLALGTWRTVHVRRQTLDAHQMVNRLVLARACALVGALVAGVYLGYAISWLGSPSELADERIWRSVAATVGGVTIVVTGKLLERACRVPKHNPHL